MYVWLGESFAVHPEVVVVAHLVGSVRHSRIECSQQPVNGVIRNLPNAEEAQDMVDSISIKIFSHLAETVLPPLIAVALHHLPIVGGESPILSHNREVVGRSASRAIHVEQLGIEPSVNARRADADWNVAFQHHMMLVGIVAHFAQLFIEVILNKIYIVDFVAIGFDKSVNLFFLIFSIFAPAVKVGCFELVAQHAIGSIGFKPRQIVLHKSAISDCRRKLLTHLGIQCFYVCLLKFVHLLIVYHCQSIKVGSFFASPFGFCFIFQFAYCIGTDIHRMQGESGIGIIRI